LVVAVTCLMRQCTTTPENALVRREVAGRFCQNALLLEAGELHSRCADDALGNRVLDTENVINLGIVCFRPYEPPRRRFGQLNADPNTTGSMSNAAVEQIARIQKASNFCRGAFRVLECEAGGFRDDKQVRETAERGNDVFGDAIAEEIMDSIAGQVL